MKKYSPTWSHKWHEELQEQLQEVYCFNNCTGLFHWRNPKEGQGGDVEPIPGTRKMMFNGITYNIDDLCWIYYMGELIGKIIYLQPKRKTTNWMNQLRAIPDCLQKFIDTHIEKNIIDIEKNNWAYKLKYDNKEMIGKGFLTKEQAIENALKVKKEMVDKAIRKYALDLNYRCK
jgi:hypothetical protein